MTDPRPAAWLLTPDALDRLPTLSADPRYPMLSPGEGREPAQADADGRYRPSGDSWPEDGITLTYGELRRLIALHLDQAWQGMPHHQPWGWVRARATAMRDGETPLLLSEVLE